jgi:hypothetical protein
MKKFKENLIMVVLILLVWAVTFPVAFVEYTKTGYCFSLLILPCLGVWGIEEILKRIR